MAALSMEKACKSQYFGYDHIQEHNFLAWIDSSFIMLGKPHSNSYWGYLGIARIAFATPPHPRTQTGTLGHFVSEKSAPNHLGKGLDPPQNQANSSQKSCPKPSGRLVIKCRFKVLLSCLANRSMTLWSKSQRDDKITKPWNLPVFSPKKCPDFFKNEPTRRIWAPWQRAAETAADHCVWSEWI